jgi:hypothetical protein
MVAIAVRWGWAECISSQEIGVSFEFVVIDAKADNNVNIDESNG